MSFFAQRLANTFPRWTKVRRDSSSMGQRFFSPFAEMLEEFTYMNKKISVDMRLLKPYLGVGYVYSVLLDDEDLFPLEEVGAASLKYTFPTVTGTTDSTEIALTQYDEMIEFLNAPPDRIVSQSTLTYTDTLVWSSDDPYVFAELPTPERLAIEVTGSTFYSRRSSVKDREFSGKHVIQIKGTDENDIQIREYVTVNDDGVFWTHNIYKTVDEVLFEGFDGAISISWFPRTLSYEPDPYRVFVIDDLEGQLKLRLTTADVGGTTYSYLVYESERLKQGSDYRQEGIESLENTEPFGEAVLLDSSSNPYVAVDLAINHQTARLYVLDDEGRIHVYDHGPNPFDAFTYPERETSSSYIELHPLQHYAVYGDSEYLYTDFARMRFPIKEIQILRIAPDGTEEYLQSDKTTWAATEAVIPARNPDADRIVDSWQDFRFRTEYDQLGVWQYYLTTNSIEDETTFLTAVMVDNLAAVVTLETDVTSPIALGFSKEGWVSVLDADEVHYYDERADVWIANPRSGQILLRSDYDSVEVTY